MKLLFLCAVKCYRVQKPTNYNKDKSNCYYYFQKTRPGVIQLLILCSLSLCVLLAGRWLELFYETIKVFGGMRRKQLAFKNSHQLGASLAPVISIDLHCCEPLFSERSLEHWNTINMKTRRKFSTTSSPQK